MNIMEYNKPSIRLDAPDLAKRVRGRDLGLKPQGIRVDAQIMVFLCAFLGVHSILIHIMFIKKKGKYYL